MQFVRLVNIMIFTTSIEYPHWGKNQTHTSNRADWLRVQVIWVISEGDNWQPSTSFFYTTSYFFLSRNSPMANCGTIIHVPDWRRQPVPTKNQLTAWAVSATGRGIILRVKSLAFVHSNQSWQENMVKSVLENRIMHFTFAPTNYTEQFCLTIISIMFP